MSDQAPIFSLPIAIWAKIMMSTVEDSVLKYNRSWKTHLKPLFRCKIASKQLNQLLDDKFFCEYSAGKKMRKMRESFSKLRMQSFIKCNNVQALVDFLNLVQSYELKPAVDQRLVDLLPLVIQETDLPFIKFFMERRPGRVYSDAVISKSILLASKRSDNNVVLFYVYEKFLHRYGSQRYGHQVQSTVGERKIDFNTAHGLVEILFTNPENDFIARLNSLLKTSDRQSQKDQIIVPQGELLFMNDYFEQRRSFKKKFSNFKIEPTLNECVLLLTYRERSGTKHRIKINRMFDISTVPAPMNIYRYENMKTKNIYELLIRTSLATRIFSSYPQQLIAVTKELLELPYEQQPWFRGIISDPVRRAIATDSPSSSTFFTYSLGNKVVLAFTETNAVSDFKHYPLKHIVLNGENIATHFPPNRFPLGVFNGGRVIGLPEHFFRRAVDKGDLDEVKRLAVEYKVDVKTNQLLSEPDNMLQAYLIRGRKDTINNDLIVWLIENGFDFVRNCESRPGKREVLWVPNLVAKMCDERTIQILARHLHFDTNAMTVFIRDRAVSIEILKSAWISSPSSGKLIQLFLEAVRNKKYPQQVHSKKTLVMTAWKHDENCLFRKLPREIVLEILSFDYIDEPPYWEFLEFAEQNGDAISLGCRQMLPRHLQLVIPFVMNHWDNPKYSNLKQNLAASFYFHPHPGSQTESEPVLKLMLKFLQRLPESEFPSSPPFASALRTYCLTTPSELAVSFLKLLLDKKGLSTENLQEMHTLIRGVTIPRVFLAVIHGNRRVLEILVEKGVFTSAMLVHFQKFPAETFSAIRQYVVELLDAKAKRA